LPDPADLARLQLREDDDDDDDDDDDQKSTNPEARPLPSSIPMTKFVDITKEFIEASESTACGPTPTTVCVCNC